MTDVVISIDLEFDLNNAFADPDASPVGRASVRSPQHPGLGLDAILDPLEQHGLRGVFFVEVANTIYFGPDEMGAIARELHERGHDLQLHVHPVWRLFANHDWRSRVPEQRPAADREDNFGALSDEQCERLLQHGFDVFAAWGVPEPVAFRSGNLMISRAGYRAMRRKGIALSSSLGRRGLEGEANAPRSTISEIEGVLEVPVTRYQQVALGTIQRDALFTLTGSSRTALRHVPEAADRQHVSPLMLLTHAAEFMPALTTPGIARVNAEKFQAFCAMLDRERERFHVVTVADSVQRWREDMDAQRDEVALPLVRGLQSFVDRVIELKIQAA